MSTIKTITSKLNDPQIRWYVWKHFGRRVYGTLSLPNQTLYVCDDMLCFPVRFSEYFRWWNPQTNGIGSRVFNRDEAWDHTNETNPSTAYPRNAATDIIFGYGGYFAPIELTDGSNKVVIHIVRKYNQILFQNMGYYITGGSRYNITLPVKVYFPPFSMSYRTNGTADADGVTISSNQYVQFYPPSETPYDIDTTKGIFATSPIGASPSYPAEIYLRQRRIINCDYPDIYLGIPWDGTSHEFYTPFIIHFNSVRSWARYGVNVSSTCVEHCVSFLMYDDDPHAGTYYAGYVPFVSYVGYALDNDNKVRFILISSTVFKHTTRWQIRGEVSSARICDLETKEWYHLGYIKPSVDMYSYGRGGAVAQPNLEWYPGRYIKLITGRDASRVIRINVDDTYTVITSPATTTWEYSDGYAYVNVFQEIAVGFEIMALYNNDGITFNPKNMGLCRMAQDVVFAALQIKPYMDRTLKANKVYFGMGRWFTAPPNLSNEEYANIARRFTPTALTDSEWQSLMASIPPFSLNLIGGAPPVRNQLITFDLPPRVNPGETFTISGTVSSPDGSLKSRNANVTILIVDPDTMSVVRSVSTVTNDNGEFIADVVAPNQQKTYKVYIIVRGGE